MKAYFKDKEILSGDIFTVKNIEYIFTIVEDVENFEKWFLLINLSIGRVVRTSSDYEGLMKGYEIDNIIKHKDIVIRGE